jgi:hypothetical protein
MLADRNCIDECWFCARCGVSIAPTYAVERNFVVGALFFSSTECAVGSRTFCRQTDRAASRLQELQKAHNKPMEGFRLGVKTRGCNGMSYTLDYAETRDKLDDVVSDKGAPRKRQPPPQVTIQESLLMCVCVL